MSELHDQPGGRVLIIANPMAENTSETLVRDLSSRCGRWFEQTVLRWTRSRGEAVEIARNAVTSADVDRPGVVVAVGGDGTAREVAQGLASQRHGNGNVPMFVVPGGTANSWYRTLWGDLPWDEALSRALSDGAPRPKHTDLARLEQTGALVMAGACAGFPPEAIHAAKSITELSGRARYDAALVRLIPTFQPYPGRVLVDDTEVHSGLTLLANVGGSRYRGGQYELLPHSVLDDGLLDVCVIGAEHPPADVLKLTRDAKHLSQPGVVYARGRRVSIERTDGKPVWFEHDGEVLVNAGHLFTLEVLPQALAVLAGETANLKNHDDAA